MHFWTNFLSFSLTHYGMPEEQTQLSRPGVARGWGWLGGESITRSTTLHREKKVGRCSGNGQSFKLFPVVHIGGGMMRGGREKRDTFKLLGDFFIQLFWWRSSRVGIQHLNRPNYWLELESDMWHKTCASTLFCILYNCCIRFRLLHCHSTCIPRTSLKRLIRNRV